jgi:hypothetical protein
MGDILLDTLGFVAASNGVDNALDRTIISPVFKKEILGIFDDKIDKMTELDKEAFYTF